MVTGIVVLLVAGVGIALKPSRKPVLVETASGRFCIISARYMVGTNLTFRSDPPLMAFYRQARKSLKIPMKGWGDIDLSGGYAGTTHAIAVLWEGPILPTQLNQIREEIDAECAEVTGAVTLRQSRYFVRNNGRVWMIWWCRDYELDGQETRALAKSPKRFRLFRKEDRHEIYQADLSE